MAETQIRFDDGAAYERMMGNWSRRAGNIFLDWLAAPPGLKWIDVGCGNGAFTELIVERWAPVEVQGIDPSEGQLAFAQKRPAARVATFSRGDAMSLSFPADTFDAATMALVIYFTPEPIKGVVEMARVVRPGGTVAAYAWDMLGGGFPLELVIACRSPMRKGDRWQHSPGLRRWRRQRHSLGSFGPWNKRGHRRSVLLRAQNRSPHAACRSPHSKSRHKLTPPPRCAAFVGVQASSSTAAS